MKDRVSSSKKAAIIAIGTEVTSGEINNTNATMIASKLTDFGFNCDLHLSVPDDRSLMRWALESGVKDHDLVVVTGGLGPTTDDFTREVIAEFLNSELEWDENSWQAIIHRLNSVGAPLAESNRRQAFFPASATIHLNNYGTASAFSAMHGNALIIVLPGPPREIEGLWHDHFHSLIGRIAPTERNQRPRRWRCLGQSESKIGELVESALQSSGLQTGYRSHAPYIDVKVWIPESRIKEFEATWRKPLESAIAPWIVGRDDEDAAVSFLNNLNHCRISILDQATYGYLAQRVFSSNSERLKNIDIITRSSDEDPEKYTSANLVVHIKADSNTGKWSLALRGKNFSKSFSETSRYKGPAHADRLQRYTGEKSLVTLTAWLTEMQSN